MVLWYPRPCWMQDDTIAKISFATSVLPHLGVPSLSFVPFTRWQQYQDPPFSTAFWQQRVLLQAEGADSVQGSNEIQTIFITSPAAMSPSSLCTTVLLSGTACCCTLSWIKAHLIHTGIWPFLTYDQCHSSRSSNHPSETFLEYKQFARPLDNDFWPAARVSTPCIAQEPRCIELLSWKAAVKGQHKTRLDLAYIQVLFILPFQDHTIWHYCILFLFDCRRLEVPTIEISRYKFLHYAKDLVTVESNTILSPSSPAHLLLQWMGRHDMDISKEAVLQ